MLRCDTRGFSLVELLVAVAIVGLLAAIAIPAYQAQVARAQVAEALAMSRAVKDAASAVYYDTGSFPTSNAAAGVGSADSYRSRYVSSVELVPFTSAPNPHVHAVIVVTLGGQARPELQGKRQPLYALKTDTGVLAWACGPRTHANVIDGTQGTLWVISSVHDTIPARLKPAECRS